MAHVSSHSNHHQVYTDFIFIGKCNHIKLPAQYLWDNTRLQKNFLLFLAIHPWWILASSTIALCGLSPATYVSNSLHLQIIIHAGLSPLFPSGSRLHKVLKISIFFMGGGCKPHTQPPTWRTRVSHLVWVITLMYLAWETLPVTMLLPTIALRII